MPAVRLLAPLSLLLLGACAQTPKTIVSIEDQADCPLALGKGQTLLVSLPSNPTTGFRWQITDPAASVLRSLGPEVYNGAQEQDMVGSGGRSVWRYKATGNGTANLQMVYRQPWEADAEPAETFNCSVTVN